jgi:hypothetical protein
MKYLLRELSFTPEDVPSKFYCVIKFDPQDEKKMSELATAQLHGVQGISQAKIIIPTFLGDGRDAMLVMNGAEVVAHNKVSKILYSNPDYLISNNFTTMMRLVAVDPTDRIMVRNLYEGIIRSLSENFRKKALFDNGLFYSLAKIIIIKNNLVQSLAKDKPQINNVNQFCVWLKNSIIANRHDKITEQDRLDIKEIPISEIAPIVGETIVTYISEFDHEGEWVLKNKTLVIPPKSDLFILIPSLPKSVFQSWKDHSLSAEIADAHAPDLSELESIFKAIKEYGLMGHYTIRLMDKTKFMAAKGRIMMTQGMNKFLSDK